MRLDPEASEDARERVQCVGNVGRVGRVGRRMDQVFHEVRECRQAPSGDYSIVIQN